MQRALVALRAPISYEWDTSGTNPTSCRLPTLGNVTGLSKGNPVQAASHFPSSTVHDHGTGNLYRMTAEVCELALGDLSP